MARKEQFFLARKGDSMEYVDLHRHSMYSHDGSGTIEASIIRAKGQGQKALGLTDHGIIDGLIEFDRFAKKEGILPVLGCELYFQPVFVKGSFLQWKKRGC